MAFAAVLAAGLAAACALRLRLNTSASLPVGIYWLSSASSLGSQQPPAGAALVLACPPEEAARLARERGYLPAGRCPGGVQPLGKMVVALAGDEVELSARGVAVNGTLLPGSRLRATDSAGRPLDAAPAGRRRLLPGEVWLFAPHPRSFDSRYFGPLATDRVLGTLAPLWTGRDARLAALSALVRAARRSGSGRRAGLAGGASPLSAPSPERINPEQPESLSNPEP